jgi:hypothetical protein
MAAVPTFETLLIEIRKSFGLSLTKERSKFVHVKSSEGVHKRLFNELKDDLVKYLGLSENDAFAFESQVKDWSATSLKLNQSLWSGRSSQKQLLWLLATHIYIPSLAKLAAFWQREDIMDKGMPANLFWYLPEEINGELHLPITQVWNWLEDLIFDPSNTLEDQVFGAENKESKSKRLGITEESFKRTLSNWKKTTGKESVKLIEDYFSQDLIISFKGTFKHNDNESLDENFRRAVKLVKDKGYTSKTLYPEIQLDNEKVVDQILTCECNDELKRRFLDLIEIRFSEPSNQKIIRFFSMAQAFQNAYVRFGRIIEGKGFDATNSDSKKNRLVQLIAIFKFIYNSTYKVSLDINPDSRKELFNREERAFDQEIPVEYRITLFQTVCGKGKYDGLSKTIIDLNLLVSELEPNIILDVLDFPENDTSKFHLSLGYISETKKYLESVSGFNIYKKIYSINDLILKIKEEESDQILILIGYDRFFNQSVRQAAFHRLDEMNLSPKRRLEQYIAQLAVMLNNELKLDRPQNSESLVAGILKRAKSIDGYDALKSDFIQFEAKHELSKGYVDTADQLFKKALDLPDKMSVGSNRGEIARDLFALRAFNKTNGYSLNNQETLYRDMKYFGGFDIPSSLGLYWMGDDSTTNVNSIFPSIHDLEIGLIDYYPEMFKLYAP